jgi:DNA invertase Pin-like site-specific DNA recombinase
MESEDFGKRIAAVRTVRSQRAAAERAIPHERLRREIREAFEHQDPRDRDDDPPPSRERDPSHRPDS